VVIGGGRRRVDEAIRDLPEGGTLADIPVGSFPLLKDYTGRGVITTATYPARQFGVGSAMGLMKAAKLCPQAIILPVDFDEYRRYSRAFKQVILEVAPLMEDRGVDEVYIDFTDVPGGQRDGGRSLARLIQKAILDATGLTCSIGVAPNKLIAKMASEFDKPNGISVVYEDDLRRASGRCPAQDQRHRPQGRREAASAWHRDHRRAGGAGPRLAVDNFGKATGAWMHEVAWGRDDRPVVTESEPVSMSRETTFERDLHAVRDRAELGAIFTTCARSWPKTCSARATWARPSASSCATTTSGSPRATRPSTASPPTRRPSARWAGQCLKRVPLERPLRLLGVRVGALAKAGSPEALAPAGAQRTAPEPVATTASLF
jgi:DNA polymerase-4